MIIHTRKYSPQKTVQGRGLVTASNNVHGGGFLDQIIPAAISFATNPQSAINVGTAVKELASSGANIGKAIKDGVGIYKLKEKPDILKMINEIKRIHIEIGFCKI